jgi:hypothetical protein
MDENETEDPDTDEEEFTYTCECGNEAMFCHVDDLDENGAPLPDMAFCCGRYEAYIYDGVPASDMVHL